MMMMMMMMMEVLIETIIESCLAVRLGKIKLSCF